MSQATADTPCTTALLVFSLLHFPSVLGVPPLHTDTDTDTDTDTQMQTPSPLSFVAGLYKPPQHQLACPHIQHLSICEATKPQHPKQAPSPFGLSYTQTHMAEANNRRHESYQNVTRTSAAPMATAQAFMLVWNETPDASPRSSTKTSWSPSAAKRINCRSKAVGSSEGDAGGGGKGASLNKRKKERKKERKKRRSEVSAQPKNQKITFRVWWDKRCFPKRSIQNVHADNSFMCREAKTA